jgi:glycosyltransferase involved in cell wall biosynthesis
VELLGNLSNDAIADLYSKCKAFVFPGKEDFGITPLEAMAAGAPVIAFGEGGVIESVTPQTGTFFTPQTVEALMDAVTRFEKGEVKISEQASRERAHLFSRERFQKEFATAVQAAWVKRGKNPDLLQINQT